MNNPFKIGDTVYFTDECICDGIAGRVVGLGNPWLPGEKRDSAVSYVRDGFNNVTWDGLVFSGWEQTSNLRLARPGEEGYVGPEVGELETRDAYLVLDVENWEFEVFNTKSGAMKHAKDAVAEGGKHRVYRQIAESVATIVENN